MKTSLDEQEAVEMYKSYYADAAFTFVTDRSVDLKQVTNTNKALLHVEKHDDLLLVVSVIDNLLKGASGQAVQNMNLMLGLEENAVFFYHSFLECKNNNKLLIIHCVG